MPTRIAGFDLFLSCEPNLAGGFLCYPRIIRGGDDYTAEAMTRVFGQARTFFEGLDENEARQRAIDQLTPVLEELADQLA